MFAMLLTQRFLVCKTIVMRMTRLLLATHTEWNTTNPKKLDKSAQSVLV